MSPVAVVSVTFVGEDGNQAQTVWATEDVEAAHDLMARLAAEFGEPCCEALLDADHVASIRAASEAARSGRLVVFAGQAGGS